MSSLLRALQKKYHEPSPDELKKMDDMLLDIQRQYYDLHECMLDPIKVEVKKIKLNWIVKKRKELINKLDVFVKNWHYVPMCAANYLP